jgi:hypothetical protein
MKRHLRRRGRCHAKHRTDRRCLDEMTHQGCHFRRAALQFLNFVRQRTYGLTAQIGVDGAQRVPGVSNTDVE